MTDFLSPAERSIRMSLIKSKDTGPELTFRRLIHRMGFRYRLHNRGLPGKPDLVFARYQAVVFIHGCFWHHHPGCKVASTPKTNVDFWKEKFAKNVERDAKNKKSLEKLGWRVFIIWECELSTATKAEAKALEIATLLTRSV